MATHGNDGLILLRRFLPLALSALLLGCGGSGSLGPPDDGGKPGGGEGGRGSLRLHVIWPQASSREIPPETTLIDLEITGEGLPTSRMERIQRPASSLVVSDLPIGQKGIAATARAQENGPALAFGFASTVVEAGKVKDVAITLRQLDASGVAQARAMVQEVRDSAITLGESFADELTHQAMVWELDLVPAVALTLQRLDFVVQVMDELGANDADPGVYQARIIHGPHRWDLVLHWVQAGSSPDTWEVIFPQFDTLVGGMKLVYQVTQADNNLSAHPGQFEVTSEREPSLRYEGQLTVQTDDQQRVTAIQVTASFQDKFLPVPITVEGNLSGEPLDEKSYRQISFTGRLRSAQLDLEVGEAKANFDPPIGAEGWPNFLTRLALTNFHFQTKDVLEPVDAQGNLVVEMLIDQETETQGPLVKKGSFTGTYQSPTLVLDGAIAFDWQNPQRDMIEPPKGTASISGRWAMPNRPIFSASLAMTANSPFVIDIDLSRGSHFLRGQLTGDWKISQQGDLTITQWALALRNEDDLLLELSGTPTQDGLRFGSGTITSAQGNKLADIEKDPDLKLVMIRYTDGTLESLLPTDLNFNPHPITGTVRGRVVDDSTGQGLGSAWVSSSIDSSETDAQGFFELRAIAGQQILSVDRWPYDTQQVEVQVPPHGEVDVGEIRLHKTGIFGTVTDAESGTALANVFVHAIGSGYSTTTNPEGRYEIVLRQPGTDRVQFWMENYNSVEQEVTLAQGEFKQLDVALQYAWGPRFSLFIQPIFTAKCAVAGCHTGSSPAAGLDLTAGNAYSNLVNVPSSQDPSWMRVMSYSPDMSLLYLKVKEDNPPLGARMPFGRSPLSQEEQQRIFGWIQNGAQNN